MIIFKRGPGINVLPKCCANCVECVGCVGCCARSPVSEQKQAQAGNIMQRKELFCISGINVDGSTVLHTSEINIKFI